MNPYKIDNARLVELAQVHGAGLIVAPCTWNDYMMPTKTKVRISDDGRQGLNKKVFVFKVLKCGPEVKGIVPGQYVVPITQAADMLTDKPTILFIEQEDIRVSFDVGTFDIEEVKCEE